MPRQRIDPNFTAREIAEATYRSVYGPPPGYLCITDFFAEAAKQPGCEKLKLEWVEAWCRKDELPNVQRGSSARRRRYINKKYLRDIPQMVANRKVYNKRNVS